MISRKSAAVIIASGLVIYSLYYNAHYNHVYKMNASYELKEVGREPREVGVEPISKYSGMRNSTIESLEGVETTVTTSIEPERQTHEQSSEHFLINTTGCYIPNYGKKLVFKEPKLNKMNCGERAIFIKRVEKDKIVFRIDNKIMEKIYTKKKNTICCYKFATRSKIAGKEDTHLSYTPCKPFQNDARITLEEEIITVTCVSPPDKHLSLPRIVYEDAYVFVKKLATKTEAKTEKSWNVLMLGMDTMSRARFLNSMPNTMQYFRSHGWLDYKGYQKVGSNTFPNLMAIFTGKKLRTIYKECGSGMEQCNDLIIWSRFREADYITAYGEDNLSLPDTFSRYKGFRTPPTDHYLRPLFLTGEKTKGNLVCAKHKPSAKHLLDYASEFASTYKNDKFFGMFWLNSYSHNLNNVPTLLDKDIVSLFEDLNKSGAMNNTIVIFLSDHGIRFGGMRVPMESYYEERLPMFFVWIPHDFRQLYAEKYYNMQLNQNRLVTPYDLHATLTEIANSSKDFSDAESDACPQCKSLFEAKSGDRTCADAGVDDKWCSCHTMTKVESGDIGGNTSLQIAVNYIQNRSNSIETIDCMKCHSLQLETVLRIYSYVDNNKTHYVVAWRMAPGNVSFEATVVKDGNDYTILQPTDTISAYNTRGNCVKKANERPFCVCKGTPCS